MTSIILKLPVPPSLNHAWGQRTIISKNKKTVLWFCTEEMQLFKKYTVKEYEKIKTPDCKKLFDARLKLHIIFSFKDRRRRDVDNYVKVLQDSLQKVQVFKDDTQIDQLLIERDYNLLNFTILKLEVYKPVKNIFTFGVESKIV